MEDLLTRTARLRRPRLMIEAARHAEPHYKRDRDLPGLLGCKPPRGAALNDLLEMEKGYEALRLGNRARYRAGRHVAVLSALMAEDRALRQALSDKDHMKASGMDALRPATKAASASATAGSISGA